MLAHPPRRVLSASRNPSIRLIVDFSSPPGRRVRSAAPATREAAVVNPGGFCGNRTGRPVQACWRSPARVCVLEINSPVEFGDHLASLSIQTIPDRPRIASAPLARPASSPVSGHRSVRRCGPATVRDNALAPEPPRVLEHERSRVVEKPDLEICS
jgi:hypothetical protein